MDFKWLDIPNTFSNSDPRWRAAYLNWIAENRPSREKYRELPKAEVYACPHCGNVKYCKDSDSFSAQYCSSCGESGQCYAIFGEHERNAIETAVRCWQNDWRIDQQSAMASIVRHL